MRRDRLIKLYEFFKTVPKDQVDLNAWECGTHACLGGWACRMPEFQALGLKLEDDVLSFQGELGFDALADFFELDDFDAQVLFATSYGISEDIHKNIALQRLERILAKEE